MQPTLDYLNHASMLIGLGQHRLLCDPWYSGTAFAGGWGLCYENPDALERAAQATHLWISHWHSDHLHVPTLQALQRENPKLTVLANASANFSTVQRMRSLGFHNVIELPERRPISLAADLTLTRYPTAGIDNMLLIQAPGWSILNYNDCNLRPGALAALRDKLGPIDLLLTNYNHAGKLYERQSPELEQRALWDALVRVVDTLGPARVVPFASSHYYRSQASRSQNQSLLDFDDLERGAASDARFCVLRVGDRARFASPNRSPQVEPRLPRIPRSPELIHDYGASVPWEELLRAAGQRCEQLQRGFPLSGQLIAPLRVELTDLGRVLVLDIADGAHAAGPGTVPHISAHSRAVHDWLGRPYGDDSFIAGAHFAVCSSELALIKRWVALGLLHASQLSIRHGLRYLRSREGLRFFWSRREEIASIFTNGLGAGEMRG